MKTPNNNQSPQNLAKERGSTVNQNNEDKTPSSKGEQVEDRGSICECGYTEIKEVSK